MNFAVEPGNTPSILSTDWDTWGTSSQQIPGFFLSVCMCARVCVCVSVVVINTKRCSSCKKNWSKRLCFLQRNITLRVIPQIFITKLTAEFLQVCAYALRSKRSMCEANAIKYNASEISFDSESLPTRLGQTVSARVSYYISLSDASQTRAHIHQNDLYTENVKSSPSVICL